MIGLLPLLAGAATWTAAEYCIHRFVGHGPRRRRPASLLGRLSPGGLAAAFNAEHLAHHADPSYFAPSTHKAAAAALVVPAVGALAALLAGPGRGASLALGLGAMYAVYEVVHRRIHTHGPRGPLTRALRRHHLHHHYRAPRTNHGVTSPIWDLLIGTLTKLPDGERLRVPAHLAPRWLTDPASLAARAVLARDYEVVGASGP